MYLVSACLCGVNCKYSGKNNFKEECFKLLQNGEAILVCPEQLGGLTTPRRPSEIQGSTSEIIENNIGKVVDNLENDVTNQFIRGAEETLNIAKQTGIKLAILKDGSPSCGSKYIYDGSFSGKKIKGEGITTIMLRNNGIKVISDEDYVTEISIDEK